MFLFCLFYNSKAARFASHKVRARLLNLTTSNFSRARLPPPPILAVVISSCRLKLARCLSSPVMKTAAAATALARTAKRQQKFKRTNVADEKQLTATTKKCAARFFAEFALAHKTKKKSFARLQTLKIVRLTTLTFKKRARRYESAHSRLLKVFGCKLAGDERNGNRA